MNAIEMQGGREMLPLNTDEDGTHLGQALRTPDMTEDERKRYKARARELASALKQDHKLALRHELLAGAFTADEVAAWPNEMFWSPEKRADFKAAREKRGKKQEFPLEDAHLKCPTCGAHGARFAILSEREYG